MRTSADVLVVGAGIVGAACAYYLSERGQQVVIIERNFPASGTSRACDGLVLLWDKLPGAEFELGLASQNLWRQLNETLDVDFGFETSGTVFLAELPDQLESGRKKARNLWDAGQHAEMLNPMELRKLEPELAPDLAGGVLFPDDIQVDPRRATLGMLAAAQRRGTRLYSGAGVIQIEVPPNGKTGPTRLTTPQGEFEAPAVVCAAGVWSAAIARLAGFHLPIRPRKGHILVSEIAPKKIHHPLLEGDYAASVQSTAEDRQVALVAEMTASGTLLLGSSREFAGYDRRVSTGVLQAIAKRAMRFLPGLGQSTIMRSYAGLRPWSPDHLPLIGPMQHAPGFYIASGHEGAGIGLAPITGQLIAKWICQEAIPLFAIAVLPDRFGTSFSNGGNQQQKFNRSTPGH